MNYPIWVKTLECKKECSRTPDCDCHCSWVERVLTVTTQRWGAQLPSRRVLESRPRDCGFEPHPLYCVIPTARNIDPCLILVRPRKILPDITEKKTVDKDVINQIKQKQTPQWGRWGSTDIGAGRLMRFRWVFKEACIANTGVRCLKFGMRLHLRAYIFGASSECYNDTTYFAEARLSLCDCSNLQ